MGRLVGLVDADQTKFPNLALMKLSAWHKAQDDRVYWWQPEVEWDVVYCSKVFTWTPTPEGLPPHTIFGGVGMGDQATMPDDALPDGIEHICPDYSLYGSTRSQGFLTRGCHRKCPWCFVPNREGMVRAHAQVDEFLRHNEVVLMDNNILAHPHGVAQIEYLALLGVRVDFNQGLDARLIDAPMARLLSRLKWLQPLRLACDNKGQMASVQNAVKWLRYYNTVPSRFFVYVLVTDIEDALERIQFLKGIHLDPFAQAFRDTSGAEPTHEQKQFVRWVNRKAVFRKTPWEEYNASTKKGK